MQLFLRKCGLSVVLATAVVLLGCSSADRSATAVVVTRTPPETFEEIFLEPADTPGADPFLADGVRGPIPDREQLDAPRPGSVDRGTVSLSGDTENLFAAYPDRPACDPEQLIEILNGDEEKGRAWAAVHGIDQGDIAHYVNGLTPVVLTGDTRVTNHGYLSGDFIARNSTLEAGTAVLIDTEGVPRVRCACGNPLLQPEALREAVLVGDPWEGFDRDSVEVIVPASDPVGELRVFDLTSGQSYVQPLGLDNMRSLTFKDPDISDFCTGDCGVTGQVEVEHPTWGKIVLVTYRGSTSGRFGGIVAMDGAQVRWQASLPEASGVSIDFEKRAFPPSAEPSAEPHDPIDSLGHIFVAWNPGRYDGLTVLRPVDGGFEDFGSLPDVDEYQSRFYSSYIVDLDDDGAYEIRTYSNDCDPSCAEGTTTAIDFSWSGSNYEESNREVLDNCGGQPVCSAEPVVQGFIGAVNAIEPETARRFANQSAFDGFSAWWSWDQSMGEVLVLQDFEPCRLEVNGSVTCGATFEQDAYVLYLFTLTETGGGWLITEFEFIHTS